MPVRRYRPSGNVRSIPQRKPIRVPKLGRERSANGAVESVRACANPHPFPKMTSKYLQRMRESKFQGISA